ncbi:MAG: lysophospholipase [Verrucomicrobiae bacterium]|nr:lysophospholipase [Verrucomicrobiae bacterium]NNJ44059.1 alpha/beta fold hydrolase [Akkermansiaceae bacterium]
MMNSRLSLHALPHLVVVIAMAAVMTSCHPPIHVIPQVKGLPKLASTHYVSYDSDKFGYRKWLSKRGDKKGSPETVIIGVHGISGYSGDYENMGKHLMKQHQAVAFYAPETRGQGMDFDQSRRGDIRSAKEWYKDLYTFTRLIRKLHPRSKIVWFGESMGSLIVMHAYSSMPAGEVHPDGLIVSSPIVDVKSRLPAWKLMAIRVSRMLMPKLRISLESLSEGERPVVTKDDIHEKQAAKNPWYIRRYTLRLLLELGDMASDMGQKAARVQCPVLVLHGGKDIFTREASVERFYQQFPVGVDKTRKFYPGSYHLLMYDHDRDKIFRDVSSWLKKMK